VGGEYLVSGIRSGDLQFGGILISDTRKDMCGTENTSEIDIVRRVTPSPGQIDPGIAVSGRGRIGPQPHGHSSDVMCREGNRGVAPSGIGFRSDHLQPHVIHWQLSRKLHGEFGVNRLGDAERRSRRPCLGQTVLSIARTVRERSEHQHIQSRVGDRYRHDAPPYSTRRITVRFANSTTSFGAGSASGGPFCLSAIAST